MTSVQVIEPKIDINKCASVNKQKHYCCPKYGAIIDNLKEDDKGVLFNLITKKSYKLTNKFRNNLDYYKMNKIDEQNYFLPIVEKYGEYSAYTIILKINPNDKGEDLKDSCKKFFKDFYKYAIKNKLFNCVEEVEFLDTFIYSRRVSKKIELIKLCIYGVRLNIGAKQFITNELRKSLIPISKEYYFEKYFAFPGSNCKHYYCKDEEVSDYWSVYSSYRLRYDTGTVALKTNKKEVFDWISVNSNSYPIIYTKHDCEFIADIYESPSTELSFIKLVLDFTLLLGLDYKEWKTLVRSLKWKQECKNILCEFSIRLFNQYNIIVPKKNSLINDFVLVNQPTLENKTNQPTSNDCPDLDEFVNLGTIEEEVKDETKVADIDTFNNEWNKYTKKNYKFGYFVYRIKESSYSDEYNRLLCILIEDYFREECIKSNGEIGEAIIADMVYYLSFGKFFSFESGSKITHFKYIDKYDEGERPFIWEEFQLTDYKIIIDIIERPIIPIIEKIMDEYKSMIKGVPIKCRNDTNDERDKKNEIIQEAKYMKAVFNNISRCKLNLHKFTYPRNITRIIYDVKVRLSNIGETINADRTVLGTKNGIIELVLGNEPEVKLYKQYSPFIVTRNVNAEYIPWNELELPKNKKILHYVKIWQQIYKDTIIEDDARQKIIYFNSTALDRFSPINKCFQMIGSGSNGKSVIYDNLLYTIGGYGNKLTTNLITCKPKGGAADPELMMIKDINFGLITETNRNDELIASRLKLITEAFKSGRGLYKDIETFAGSVTVAICTNFNLQVVDSDDGTWRRICSYRFKRKFKREPMYEDERLINPEYERLNMNNHYASSALLSWMVHERIEFHRKYNSIIDSIPSPTIDKETEEFRISQDDMARFIAKQIVLMYGFNVDTTKCVITQTIDQEIIRKQYMDWNLIFNEFKCIDDIVGSFKSWYEKVKKDKNKMSCDYIESMIRSSKLGKYIVDDKIIGIRIIAISSNDELRYESNEVREYNLL